MATLKKTTSSIFLVILFFLTIIFIIIFYVGMNFLKYRSIPKANPASTPTSQDLCKTDFDCIGYGTCSVNCVNKNWAAVNSDNGPFCNLLLPEFECKCIENKCKPNILDKTIQ